MTDKQATPVQPMTLDELIENFLANVAGIAGCRMYELDIPEMQKVAKDLYERFKAHRPALEAGMRGKLRYEICEIVLPERHEDDPDWYESVFIAYLLDTKGKRLKGFPSCGYKGRAIEVITDFANSIGLTAEFVEDS